MSGNTQPVLARGLCLLRARLHPIGWKIRRRYSQAFHQGYGDIAINDARLRYYRYERILADLDEFFELIIGRQATDEYRVDAMEYMASQFMPGNVVECADRAYEGL